MTGMGDPGKGVPLPRIQEAMCLRTNQREVKERAGADLKRDKDEAGLLGRTNTDPALTPREAPKGRGNLARTKTGKSEKIGGKIKKGIKNLGQMRRGTAIIKGGKKGNPMRGGRTKGKKPRGRMKTKATGRNQKSLPRERKVSFVY